MVRHLVPMAQYPALEIRIVLQYVFYEDCRSQPGCPCPEPPHVTGDHFQWHDLLFWESRDDPKTTKFVGGDASNRTVQALRNLEQVLKAGGSELSKVIKVTIFISSMDHYPKVNEGYGRDFTHDVKPCRTCVGVASLPLDAEVEIEIVAAI